MHDSSTRVMVTTVQMKNYDSERSVVIIHKYHEYLYGKGEKKHAIRVVNFVELGFATQCTAPGFSFDSTYLGEHFS